MQIQDAGVCENCRQKGRACVWEKKGKSKACVSCCQNKQACNDLKGRSFRKRARDDSEMPEVGSKKKKAKMQESNAGANITQEAWLEWWR